MLTNLTQKLKTGNEEERKKAALELAEYAVKGHDQAYSELIKMAEGRRRKILKSYNLADQVAAIEALSLTGRQDALIYLKSLQIYKEQYTESCTGLACGSDRYSQWVAISYEFVNAKKELGDKMRYSGPRVLPSENLIYLTPEEHEKIRSENPWHIAVEQVVKRLESRTPNSPTLY